MCVLGGKAKGNYGAGEKERRVQTDKFGETYTHTAHRETKGAAGFLETMERKKVLRQIHIHFTEATSDTNSGCGGSKGLAAAALAEQGGMKLDEAHGSSAQSVEKLRLEKDERQDAHKHWSLGNWKRRHARGIICRPGDIINHILGKAIWLCYTQEIYETGHYDLYIFDVILLQTVKA
jgi:hypothetical protein